jgi:hypothetical protein
MPNWCNNFAVIRHEDPAKISALADAFDAGKFCDHVIPVPKDLTDTVAGSVGEDKRAEHEAQMKRNLELHGAKDWYDFCVSRWGTKWDVGGDGYTAERDDDNQITVSFDSAWSPPTGVYEELVEQGFEVDAMYYESGMAYCGRFVNGDDNYTEIGDMSADQVADQIDPDIDECFGISESIREYEEENEEDLHRFVREGADKLGLIAK